MTGFENAAVEIIRLGMWNHRVQYALAKDVDLPIYSLECLLVLFLDHPESAGALADSLGIRKSSLSKLLNGLEERGLVHRELDPVDRRMERLTLTEAANALVDRVHTRASEIAMEMLAKLPEERRSQFLRCVRTITSQKIPADEQSQSNLTESSRESIIS
jgi:MarR family transcriptional regulator, lower aerobic nicotinate degradation pathway regulator